MPDAYGNQTEEERAAAAKAAQPKQAQPSSYTNFNRYFNANQASAQRGANKIASNVGQQAQAVNDQLKAKQTEFNTNIGAASSVAAPKPDDNTTMQDYENYYGPDYVNKMANQEYAGPEGLYNAYTGTGPNPDAAPYEAAQQSVDALKTSGGIQALLQNQGGGGGYGSSAFSSNLLGAAGRNQFDALRNQFNPQKSFEDAQKQAADQVAAARATTTTNAKSWGDMASDMAARQALDNIKNQKIESDYQAQLAARASTAKTDAQRRTQDAIDNSTYKKTYNDMSDDEKTQWLRDHYTKETQNSPALQNMFGSSLDG